MAFLKNVIWKLPFNYTNLHNAAVQIFKKVKIANKLYDIPK